MAITYILFNPKAGRDNDGEIRRLEHEQVGEWKSIDLTKVSDYRAFLGGLTSADCLILCGGDGTLNRFVNATDKIDCPCEIFYCPMGTGNDFALELGYQKGCAPIPVTDYLKDLPTVSVNGKQYRFLNGVGYGIDGYCCEVGDRLKETSDKPINYTAIAVKGLLFHYKPTTAKVTVDGVSHTYQKVWLAPTMNGRFYGGGMIPCPMQNRNDPARMISVMIYHGVGKLRGLMVFPSIFKGEHVNHTDMVEVLQGHEITVEFDRPTPLQIDGETILGVTSYTATSPVRAKNQVQSELSV
ncbi:MAG: diacylglycerol/lipid kinase family protein [Eubacteriales bacterium]